VTPRAFCTRSSSRGRRRLPDGAAAALLLAAAAGCAKPLPPSPDVARRAAALQTYSADVRVSVRGSLRGGSRALVAFRRPDALRIEIPGPSGARLLAVTSAGRLTAVLPPERAFLERPATPQELEALVGIPLSPEQLMDFLVGVPPQRARRYEARWGRLLPRRIRAVLEEGTKVDATVADADAGSQLAAAAFEPPDHAGYREVDADEARRMLGAR
jgi:hypothetical protein